MCIEIIAKTDLYKRGHYAMSISRLTKKEALGNLGYGFYVESPNNIKFESNELIRFGLPLIFKGGTSILIRIA